MLNLHINQNIQKNTKIKENDFMKTERNLITGRILKNNKGFSLIELVIVVAILGVLAAVSITMFPKIAGQSRIKADETQAKAIKSAIAMYIAETSDTGLTELSAAVTEDTAGAELIIANMMKGVTIDSDLYGPYLDNKLEGDASASNTLLAATIKPQELGKLGWNITVNTDTGNVVVQSDATATVNLLP